MTSVKLPKYVSKSVKNGRTFYRLRKYYNGKEIQLVQHPQLDYVLRCRTECEKVGWEKDKILELKQRFKENKPLRKDQYIYPDDKGGYRIAKWEKGRVRYYGKSHYYPEAVKIRDYLVEHDWKKPVLHKRKVSPKKNLERRDNGQYAIYYQGEYYGTYSNYMEAVHYRNMFIENNWNKRFIPYMRAHGNPNRYLYQSDVTGHWCIQKMIDGVNISFGVCYSLEEAREERDFWESINWDFDLLDLY